MAFEPAFEGKHNRGTRPRRCFSSFFCTPFQLSSATLVHKKKKPKNKTVATLTTELPFSGKKLWRSCSAGDPLLSLSATEPSSIVLKRNSFHLMFHSFVDLLVLV